MTELLADGRVVVGAEGEGGRKQVNRAGGRKRVGGDGGEVLNDFLGVLRLARTGFPAAKVEQRRVSVSRSSSLKRKRTSRAQTDSGRDERACSATHSEPLQRRVAGSRPCERACSLGGGGELVGCATAPEQLTLDDGGSVD